MRFPPRDVSGTGRCARLVSVLFVLFAWLPDAGAVITEQITSIAIDPPPVILDSDETDGDATTIRNGLVTDVEVRITRANLDPFVNADYRVTYWIEDSSGNQVELAPGGVFTASTPPFPVVLDGIFETLHVENLVINPDPFGTLDPADDYRVVGRLEEDQGGSWVAQHQNATLFGPALHFTNTASGDPEWNIRGIIFGMQWEQVFLVDTDPANDAFLVDMGAFFGRYDDFDDPIGQETTTITIDFDLLDGNNNSVPLEDDGIVTQQWIANSYNDSSGRPLPATTLVVLNDHALRPLGQLDSVNEQYRLRCTISHLEDGIGTEHTDTAETLVPETLLHFNGNLSFGTLQTQFTSIENTPPNNLGGGPTWADTVLVISDEAGVLPGNPDYVFGDGVTPLNVQLLANGNARLPAGSPQTLDVFPPGNPGAPIQVLYDCIKVDYTGGVTLGAAGAQAANLTINLPQGLGYIADYVSKPHRGSSKFSTGGPFPLTGGLQLTSDQTFLLGGNAAIFDESHPLVFNIGLFTLRLDGTLEFPTSGVKYIHEEPLAYLESIPPAQLEDPVAMRERLSNDQYLRKVNLSAGSSHQWKAAPDKSARLSGELEVPGVPFKAHFPVRTEIEPLSGSTLVYDNGVAISDSSALRDVQEVRVPYSKNCPADVDPCAGDGEELVPMTPADDLLSLTPGGGLWRAGTVPEVPLMWGARGDGGGGILDPAHETDKFKDSTFYMPGYQLYAADNPVLGHPVFGEANGDHGPGALLLSGFNEEPGSPENYYPTSKPYVAGDGSYGGLNFVVTAPGFRGLSRLGGDPAGFDYELLETNNASKYYIRVGGVNGRHVARDGTWTNPVVIYGFEFEFTSYQLAFLDSALNTPEGSWVDGSIRVQGYSNFTQGFSGLTIDCLGELTGAEIDENDLGDKSLTYWNSVFQPKSMDFSKQEINPGACPLKFEAILVMGIQTEVAHIPQTLHGVFGFWGNGNLATPADGFPGPSVGQEPITSELGIPALISLEGPNKDYSVVPTGRLRFNNPEATGHGVNDILGFVTFGATVDVPFFEDLQVQCVTSAPPIPAAPFYMTPGWTQAGKTFFDASDFDPDHQSWPFGNGDGVSLDEYLNPDPGTPGGYLVHARQSIFGKLDVDYLLDWDDNLRRFKSMEQITQEIFVVSVEHEIPYMDAKFTQIEFGAKYEGLPELSITNVLNDQIDAAADALADAISDPLKSAIDEAFEEFERMLDDTLDEALDPLIDRAAQSVLAGPGGLYQQLKASYSGALNTWQGTSLGPMLAAEIYGGNPNSELGQQLQKLSEITGLVNDAESFILELQDAVGKMIIGIDTIANQVEVNGGVPQLNLDLGSLPGGVSPGLLYQDNGEFQILSSLVRLLLENLVEPDVAAILGPLLDAATSELNAELNELLVEVEPALLQVTDALNQVRGFLVQIYGALDAAGDFIGQIQDVVSVASAPGMELEDILQGVHDATEGTIMSLVNSVGIPAAGNVGDYFSIFDEMSEEEFISLVKAEIKDQLLQSEMVSSIKYLARQNLYDLEIKFRNTIQSVFGQISEVMKEVVSSTIGALEEEFAPMLGEVSNYLGSAEITGFAEFNGDSLRKLRMDLMAEFQLPDPMKIHVYLEVLVITSEDNFTENACLKEGEKAVEIRIGAVDVPLDWISDGLRATLEVKMSLKDKGAGLKPNGVGGSLELTGGVISFQAVKITCFAVAVSVGFDECYIAAKACVIFNSYEISAGIFFGRTCTLDPLYLVDADVAELLDPGTTFTGVYIYGEIWLPISEIILGIPASCLFRISAGIGVGNGLFIEGPTFIGKMLLGVSGEALCIVSFEGIIKMVGVLQAGKFKASGSGSFKACIGFAFIKICFKATIKIKYFDDKWSVDY